MFTGIIQGTTLIEQLEKDGNNFKLKIKANNQLIKNLSIGASIAINGCCLTVIFFDSKEIWFDIIPETARCTNICALQANDLVNYERSMKLSDEISGHLTSGHIQDTAVVTSIVEDKETIITLKYQPKWDKYIFPKGFITANGCSLTIGEKQDFCFNLYLIPETLKITTFKFIKIGDLINIELDNNTISVVDTVYKIMNNINSD